MREEDGGGGAIYGGEHGSCFCDDGGWGVWFGRRGSVLARVRKAARCQLPTLTTESQARGRASASARAQEHNLTRRACGRRRVAGPIPLELRSRRLGRRPRRAVAGAPPRRRRRRRRPLRRECVLGGRRVGFRVARTLMSRRACVRISLRAAGAAGAQS
jgi:hypothetical protein